MHKGKELIRLRSYIINFNSMGNYPSSGGRMINDQFCGKIGFVNNFAQKLCCFYNFMFHLLGRVYECVTAADSVNCKCGSATYTTYTT